MGDLHFYQKVFSKDMNTFNQVWPWGTLRDTTLSKASGPFDATPFAAFIAKAKPFRFRCRAQLDVPSPEGRGRALRVDVTQHLAPTPPKSQQIHFIRNAKTVFYLRGRRTNTVQILLSQNKKM